LWLLSGLRLSYCHHPTRIVIQYWFGLVLIMTGKSHSGNIWIKFRNKLDCCKFIIVFYSSSTVHSADIYSVEITFIFGSSSVTPFIWLRPRPWLKPKLDLATNLNLVRINSYKKSFNQLTRTSRCFNHKISLEPDRPITSSTSAGSHLWGTYHLWKRGSFTAKLEEIVKSPKF